MKHRTQSELGSTFGAIRSGQKIEANPPESTKMKHRTPLPAKSASAPPGAVIRRTQSEPGSTFGAIRSGQKIEANPR